MNNDDKKEFKRISEWKQFSIMMENYLEKYTIQKYKTSSEDIDLVEIADAKYCIFSILKYAMRLHNGRGKDFDLHKIAHYAQLAYDKLQKENKNDYINSEKAG